MADSIAALREAFELQYTEACQQIDELTDRIAVLTELCQRAADALEEEFGAPLSPAYGMKGPVHDLITQLRKTAK